MYQALLTRRYLTSKLMPVLAMLAVMLSVGTVLVTWSVMGGFLRVLVESGRKLVGDVTITWPNVGFPYYDDLIERLEAHPEITAACATVETFGVLSLPDDQVRLVSLKGVHGPSYDRVTGFADTLWWRPLDEPTARDETGEDPRLSEEGFWRDSDWPGRLRQGLSLTTPDGDAAAVPGIEVSGWNARQYGIYLPYMPARAAADGEIEYVPLFLPDATVTIHVIPLDSTGRGVEAVTRRVPVVNEFSSGVYEADSRTVMLRLDLLQSMLKMDRAERVRLPESPWTFDPATGEVIEAAAEVVGVDPARATTVLVRTREGLTAAESKAVCEEVYAGFADAHAGEVPASGVIQIRSWRDLNATLIAAVEKETGLVLFVFGLVCFTTVFLVLAIFWSMVSEKTKDIGILRSLGAGTAGVTWLWLRYGAAVGVVGALLGLGAAAAVVWNINEIHNWLGEELGLVIWDPSIYRFTEIPSDMGSLKPAVVTTAGVLTCLVGAAVPAFRAGRMDPVRALRFE